MNPPIPTHAQAEILLLIEAKFAQPLGSIEGLSPWINDVAALGNRYCAGGGTLDELQARFNDARTPPRRAVLLFTEGTLLKCLSPLMPLPT